MSKDADTAIPPALTAEEWAAQRYDRGDGLRAYLHDAGGSVGLVLEDGGDICGAYVTSELHAVAALANAALRDTDPRKITRARLAALDTMLQDAAVLHGDRCSGKEADDAARDLRLAWDLHDALAALLPTE